MSKGNHIQQREWIELVVGKNPRAIFLKYRLNLNDLRSEDELTFLKRSISLADLSLLYDQNSGNVPKIFDPEKLGRGTVPIIKYLENKIHDVCAIANDQSGLHISDLHERLNYGIQGEARFRTTLALYERLGIIDFD